MSFLVEETEDVIDLVEGEVGVGGREHQRCSGFLGLGEAAGKQVVVVAIRELKPIFDSDLPKPGAYLSSMVREYAPSGRVPGAFVQSGRCSHRLQLQRIGGDGEEKTASDIKKINPKVERRRRVSKLVGWKQRLALWLGHCVW